MLITAALQTNDHDCSLAGLDFFFFFFLCLFESNVGIQIWPIVVATFLKRGNTAGLNPGQGQFARCHPDSTVRKMDAQI